MAAGSLLMPAAAAAKVYEQATLVATGEVRTWVSKPRPEPLLYLHLYDRRLERELSQAGLTRCRARYAGFGLSAAVAASGCRNDPVPDDGRVRVRFVSVSGPRMLLVRITDSADGERR
jgi:hypothetical protein